MYVDNVSPSSSGARYACGFLRSFSIFGKGICFGEAAKRPAEYLLQHGSFFSYVHMRSEGYKSIRKVKGIRERGTE